jgi:hypothetical protein
MVNSPLSSVRAALFQLNRTQQEIRLRNHQIRISVTIYSSLNFDGLDTNGHSAIEQMLASRGVSSNVLDTHLTLSKLTSHL